MTDLTPDSSCAACGCDRVFHRIGTGHGVPVGKEFCDDRHASPCSCAGFVVKSRIMMQNRDDTEEAAGQRTVTVTVAKLKAFENAVKHNADAEIAHERAYAALIAAQHRLDLAKRSVENAVDAKIAATKALYESEEP